MCIILNVAFVVKKLLGYPPENASTCNQILDWAMLEQPMRAAAEEGGRLHWRPAAPTARPNHVLQPGERT